MLYLRLQFENKNSKSNIPTVFRIEAGIHTLLHQNNNVEFKMFGMSGW